MIHDRGSIKWATMMLPEHLKLIRGWEQQQFYVERRELAEWELDEIEQTIQHAFKMQKLITLTLWGDNKLCDETGLIKGADAVKRELLLDTDVAIKRLAFDRIQDAKMIEADD